MRKEEKCAELGFAAGFQCWAPWMGEKGEAPLPPTVMLYQTASRSPWKRKPRVQIEEIRKTAEHRGKKKHRRKSEERSAHE